MSGIVEFGKHVLADKTTIYPDTHGFALEPENFTKKVLMIFGLLVRNDTGT